MIAVAGVIAGGVPLWEMPERAAGGGARRQPPVGRWSPRVSASRRCSGVRSRASGRFVAVASAAATRGLPMLAAYCAAKAGVTGPGPRARGGARGTGITANAVSPGSTATPILDESARLYGLESAEAFSVAAAASRG